MPWFVGETGALGIVGVDFIETVGGSVDQKPLIQGVIDSPRREMLGQQRIGGTRLVAVDNVQISPPVVAGTAWNTGILYDFPENVVGRETLLAELPEFAVPYGELVIESPETGDRMQLKTVFFRGVAHGFESVRGGLAQVESFAEQGGPPEPEELQFPRIFLGRGRRWFFRLDFCGFFLSRSSRMRQSNGQHAGAAEKASAVHDR